MTRAQPLRFEKETVVAAGAFSPFVARLVEEAGFGAVYISGAALSNSLGRPDEGQLTLRDVERFTRSVCDVVSIPVIVDVDTGFGGPVGVATTVRRLHAAGAAALQIEDQDPRYKRCGHLDGKRLISSSAMANKVRAAIEARGADGPRIIARTDARAVEGFDAAVARANAYVEAGADAIFPEALLSREEFAAFRARVPAPLVANMTEYGKTPWITDAEFADLGYEVVLHPVTTFRLAAKAVEDALATMRSAGHQRPLVEAGQLMTRAGIDARLVREDG